MRKIEVNVNLDYKECTFVRTGWCPINISCWKVNMTSFANVMSQAVMRSIAGSASILNSPNRQSKGPLKQMTFELNPDT